MNGGWITKLCRQQAEVIQNHDNENVRNIGQGKARYINYKRLKLGGGHVYVVHVPVSCLDCRGGFSHN
jgi:exosome complex RNA-binding protein Rrp42 (RNase PH superfamily)